MQLLDSYLKTVARFLPAADRDDIVRELSENLRSQIEDREAHANRPLSDAEVKALLDAFGTPLEIAGRYRHTTGVVAFGRILIGPVLFPFYAKILAFLLSLTAAVIIVIAVALRIPAANAAQALLVHLSIQFGIVTLIFSLAQIGFERRPRRFDVSYPLSYITPLDKPETPRISRLESLSQIVMLAILLGWLPALKGFVDRGVSEGGLAPAPVWGEVYIGLAGLWGAAILCASVNLFRPGWTRFWLATRLVLDLAWLGILALLVRAGSWVVPLQAGSGFAVAAPHVAEVVNHWVFVGLVALAVVSVLHVLHDVRRSITGRRGWGALGPSHPETERGGGISI